MQASEVMALLQEHASADARALLGPRYGIHVDDALGVSMADMKRLARPSDATTPSPPTCGRPASTRRASWRGSSTTRRW